MGMAPTSATPSGWKNWSRSLRSWVNGSRLADARAAAAGPAHPRYDRGRTAAPEHQEASRSDVAAAVMTEEWRLRTTAVELSRRYRGWGLWDDQTLGALIESGLRRGASSAFRVRSREHPWSGTLGDVHRLARRVAGGLRARGIGPGDVVAFQLPNWVEAAATFYGCSLLGAVVVPVVHFYGAHEVAHILRQSRARVFVCAAHFRHLDGLAILEQVAARLPDLELSVVVGEAGGRRLSFDVLADAPPVDAACVADPDGPALIAYTSGTTAEPRGAVHTHRSIGAEVRQLAAAAPSGPPALVGAPISH